MPYETYLLSDFEKQYKEYKAVVFPVPVTSAELEKATDICKAHNIPYLLATPEKWNYSSTEIREFSEKAGVFVFCDTDDVIYFGNGLLGIHAASKGEKAINLPKISRIKKLYSKEKSYISDNIKLEMNKFETQLFLIDAIQGI